MKGRESGMPDEERWAEFFDPAEVIARLGCVIHPGDMVEFGCGYGTFAFPVASGLQGTLYAIDIDPEMISRIEEEVRRRNIANVRPIERDFVALGTGIPAGTMIHAMLFNILHIENPLGLLREAWRVLAPGGTVSVIHWRRDIPTPRGPSLDIRPSPDQCKRWAEDAGFSRVVEVALGEAAPWHFGLVLEK